MSVDAVVIPTTGDPVASMLLTKAQEGIDAIVKANETLLAEEKGTPIREIDKALKAEDAPEEFKNAMAQVAELQARFKEALDSVRNKYRTEVLDEDAQESSDDSEKDNLKAEVKEHRDLTMESLKFLAQYAAMNGLTEVAEWANSIEVPHVGRNGSSSVGGNGATGGRKHRVNVVVDDEKTYGSFTETAQAITTKENKVAAGDITEAWISAIGETEGTFEFAGHVLSVTFKTKK